MLLDKVISICEIIYLKKEWNAPYALDGVWSAPTL